MEYAAEYYAGWLAGYRGDTARLPANPAEYLCGYRDGTEAQFEDYCFLNRTNSPGGPVTPASFRG